MIKRVALTGITGQVGSKMAEMLLEMGYEVHGLIRRSSSFNTGRIDHIFNKLHLVHGDITDFASVSSWVSDIQPYIFINFAAQSHVKVSFETPINTSEITGLGALKCLEAVRKFSPETRYINLATSEIFGSTPPPQNETTLMHPRSPYACAKLFAYNTVINYREAYDMFACNAIMFNTEGPSRGETFITRKITRAATRIKLGLQDKLYLGNLEAKRSWNHVVNSCEALLLIAESQKPDDYVIGDSEMHSVKEFVEMVFSKLGLNWKDYVEIDPKYFRPTEVDALQPDSSKIKRELGWEPKYTFEDLVDEMIDSDYKLALQEKLLKDHK